MFYIKENNIYLTQGDDALLAVSMVDASGKPVKMGTGDTLTLKAKTSTSASTAAITATSTDNKITLSHTATASLNGLYIYQIQLTKANGNIYTIAQGNLTVTGDVIV